MRASEMETSSAAHREVLTLRVVCGCVEVLTEGLLLSVPGVIAAVCGGDLARHLFNNETHPPLPPGTLPGLSFSTFLFFSPPVRL